MKPTTHRYRLRANKFMASDCRYLFNRVLCAPLLQAYRFLPVYNRTIPEEDVFINSKESKSPSNLHKSPIPSIQPSTNLLPSRRSLSNPLTSVRYWRFAQYLVYRHWDWHLILITILPNDTVNILNTHSIFDPFHLSQPTGLRGGLNGRRPASFPAFPL